MGCNIVRVPTKVILHIIYILKDILAGNTYSIILSLDAFIYICAEPIKGSNGDSTTMSCEVMSLYNEITNVKYMHG
ncbi:hypothetical protein PFDG_05359 [Plasmodium falciparum Dd2]|uniref:Uncharacterized protein n=1 Tax=Plasmodium falciparum (isolate Dd2) TaxID=57267 RepID=A0A0L7MB64_PLAF4|nr:hypothetical protein PFDG_05359 [Plasmodium falciparum Dd2]